MVIQILTINPVKMRDQKTYILKGLISLNLNA